MSITEVVQQFANDKQLHGVLILIALDLVLGVFVAVRTGQFAFSKISAFLKDDVLGKVLPWFAIFSFAKFAPAVSVIGVDLNQIQTVAWGLVTVALVFSLTSSLNDLGLGKTLPKAITTGENEGVAPKPSA